MHHRPTKMDVSSIVLFLRQRAAFFLQLTTIALDVFHHQIFPCQFIVVGEMIDDPEKYRYETCSSLCRQHKSKEREEW